MHFVYAAILAQGHELSFMRLMRSSNVFLAATQQTRCLARMSLNEHIDVVVMVCAVQAMKQDAVIATMKQQPLQAKKLCGYANL